MTEDSPAASYSLLTTEELLGVSTIRTFLASGSAAALDDFAYGVSHGSHISSDVTVRVVRGARCTDRDRAFQESAAALQFPWYFGHNWDALNDCIRDLLWLNATTLVLFVTHIDRVLPQAPDEFHIFVSSLELGVREWTLSDAQPPYSAVRVVLVYHAEPDRADVAWTRLAIAGVTAERRVLPASMHDRMRTGNT